MSIDRFDYELIPSSTMSSLMAYMEDHRPTGHFLRMFLSNNLAEALRWGDDGNLTALVQIFTFCYNNLPAECWGSERAVDEWISARKET